MIPAATESFRTSILEGIPETLPPPKPRDPGVSHAPARRPVLDRAGKELALRNALRYVPPRHPEELAPELALELERHGRIYMDRYRPDYPMHARALDAYPARSRQAAAIMLMIQNNLDPAVAQHPHELITYGGNGTVFQNWAQYRLTMRYVAEMTDEETLVLYSAHPLGLFPSSPEAPRLVVTCGMVIPNHSTAEDYERLAALGVTSYGQMTAGPDADDLRIEHARARRPAPDDALPQGHAGYYIAHRQDVVVPRTRFDLSEAEKRAHILEGFKIALDHIDEIVALIRASADTDAARQGLIGYSDGASYALSVGLSNPHLFCAVMAWAAGFLALEADAAEPGTKRPAVYLTYGTHDELFPFEHVAKPMKRHREELGCAVTFVADEGGRHWPPSDFQEEALDWFFSEPWQPRS